jgi:hypothetical protein
MYVHTPVPQGIIDKLGEICLVLPEVNEEEAWVGRRWMVRKKNFAHVLMVDKAYPPTYARVAKLNTRLNNTDEPVCILTFRTPYAANTVPEYSKSPYFLPGWWPNIVGMHINDQTNWHTIHMHINASYRTLAPLKLVALL